MEKYLLIKIIAWNDPADITDCNNWGFETHTIGEVNSITEAIEKAKKDLKEYAEDWYDGEEDQEEKVKEYISQSVWEPTPEEQEEIKQKTLTNKYRQTTIYNVRYFNDETGSDTVHDYTIIKL